MKKPITIKQIEKDLKAMFDREGYAVFHKGRRVNRERLAMDCSCARGITDAVKLAQAFQAGEDVRGR